VSKESDENVVVLDCTTTHDVPLERVLEGAAETQLNDCLVLSYMPKGEFYLAATTGNNGTLLILLERARAQILRQIDV